jgi:hypothetical protein
MKDRSKTGARSSVSQGQIAPSSGSAESARNAFALGIGKGYIILGRLVSQQNRAWNRVRKGPALF